MLISLNRLGVAMAIEMISFVLLVIAAFLIAAMYSNLGLGGGIMYVPTLIMIGGLGKDSAVAASLCLVLAGSLAAFYQHRKAGNVDLRLAGLLSIGTCIGAVFGSFFNLSINEDEFRLLFLGVIIGLTIWITADLFRELRPDADDDSRMCTRYIGPAVGISIFAGFLSGAFGIGGGVILVPTLIYILCRHMKLAVGTSVATIVPTTMMGILMYFVGGSGQLAPDLWQYMAVLAPVCFVGAFLGTRVGISKLTGKQLKVAFLLLTVLVAVVMVAEFFF